MREFLNAVAHPNLQDLIVFDMPVADLYDEHWSISGNDVPDDRSSDEAVFLPGRNPLLLLKPALWCAAHGTPQLALATLSSNPFPDATPEFFARFQEMIRVATGCDVEVVRPFEAMSKRDVLQLGRGMPLELTFSCLAPARGLHCGQCNKLRGTPICLRSARGARFHRVRQTRSGRSRAHCKVGQAFSLKSQLFTKERPLRLKPDLFDSATIKAVRAALASRHRTAPPGNRRRSPFGRSNCFKCRSIARASSDIHRLAGVPYATSSGRGSYRQSVPQPSANFADSAAVID